MNTWPEKNLMTMTSDVRDKTLDHVLYLLHPDTKETKDLGPDVEEWVLKKKMPNPENETVWILETACSEVAHDPENTQWGKLQST